MFSTRPFSQEEYGCAKKILASSFLDMRSCSANSVPLSVVMVCTTDLYGSSRSMTVSATASAFLPFGERAIIVNRVSLSVSTTMASVPFLPTMVSISQSPKRSRLSTIPGRSSIPTRLRIGMNFPTGLRRCFPLCRRCL